MGAGLQYKMKDLLFNIRADIRALAINPIKAFFVSEFQAVLYFRIYSFVYHNISKVWGFLMYQRCKKNYNIDIAPTAEIKGGFVIVHLGAIVIGKDVKIKKKC